VRLAAAHGKPLVLDEPHEVALRIGEEGKRHDVRDLHRRPDRLAAEALGLVERGLQVVDGFTVQPNSWP
jgi:hypothetical protein